MSLSLYARLCRVECLLLGVWLKMLDIPHERAIALEMLQDWCKSNPDWRTQPRAPSGTPEGGRWVTVIEGAPGQPPQVINDPPLQPVYPVENILAFLLGGRAVGAAMNMLGRAGVAWRTSRLVGGRAAERTAHGAMRAVQRRISEQEITRAISSAEKTGQMIRSIGKYGTQQIRYRGSNGVTVVVETEGRNSGKVITVYRHQTGAVQ